MTAYVAYVRTSSSSGGDGTANTDSGSTRAYVSLAAAEAGERGKGRTYSGADTLTIHCSVGSGTAADTTAVSFANANWATKPGTILVINDDARGVAYNSSTFRLTATGAILATDLAANMTFDGLQVANTTQYAILASLKPATGYTHKFINGIVKNTGGGDSYGVLMAPVDSTGNGVTIVANNVIYDCVRGVINGYKVDGKDIVCNNTIIDCGNGINLGGDGNEYVYNNLIQGSGTNYYVGGAGVNGSGGNITSDTSSPESGLRSKTITFTNSGSFIFSTADSQADAGTDMSADSNYAYSTDILGTTRSAWFAGAYEPPSAVSLTGGSTTQGNASTTGAVIVPSVLTAANSSQANTSTTAAISQSNVLTAAPSSQANASTTAPIVQTNILVGHAGGGSDLQLNASATGAFTQARTLTAANSSQANASTTGAYTGTALVTLTATGVTQVNTSNTGPIAQTVALASTVTTQHNASSVAALTTTAILAGSNSLQLNASTPGVIRPVSVLTAGNSLQLNFTNTGTTALYGLYTVPASRMIDASRVTP